MTSSSSTTSIPLKTKQQLQELKDRLDGIFDEDNTQLNKTTTTQLLSHLAKVFNSKKKAHHPDYDVLFNAFEVTSVLIQRLESTLVKAGFFSKIGACLDKLVQADASPERAEAICACVDLALDVLDHFLNSTASGKAIAPRELAGRFLISSGIILMTNNVEPRNVRSIAADLLNALLFNCKVNVKLVQSKYDTQKVLVDLLKMVSQAPDYSIQQTLLCVMLRIGGRQGIAKLKPLMPDGANGAIKEMSSRKMTSEDRARAFLSKYNPLLGDSRRVFSFVLEGGRLGPSILSKEFIDFGADEAVISVAGGNPISIAYIETSQRHVDRDTREFAMSVSSLDEGDEAQTPLEVSLVFQEQDLDTLITRTLPAIEASILNVQHGKSSIVGIHLCRPEEPESHHSSPVASLSFSESPQRQRAPKDNKRAHPLPSVDSAMQRLGEAIAERTAKKLRSQVGKRAEYLSQRMEADFGDIAKDRKRRLQKSESAMEELEHKQQLLHQNCAEAWEQFSGVMADQLTVMHEVGAGIQEQRDQMRQDQAHYKKRMTSAMHSWKSEMNVINSDKTEREG